MPTLGFDHTTDEQCRWVQDEDNLALWWTGCYRYLDEGLVDQSNSAAPICCYCQKPKRLVPVTP